MIRTLCSRLLTAAAVAGVLASLFEWFAWTYDTVPGRFRHVEFGRGHRTVGVDSNVAGTTFEYVWYDRPLTHYHPHTAWCRTGGFGWFVGDVRRWGFESDAFAFVRTESDYEYEPKVFRREWRFRCPNGLVAIVASTAAALVAARRLWVRRWKRRRGFTVRRADVNDP